VSLLRDYLDGTEGLTIDTLDLDHGGDIDLEFLEDGRFVVLDLDRSELLDIDPESGEISMVATRGDGPGELQFPQDLARVDSQVFVARPDQQITVFNCASHPCAFERSIRIDFAAHAISESALSGLAVLTSLSGHVGPPQEEELERQNPPAVTMIDPEGRIATEFGERYDIDGHWVLARPFHANGSILYLPSAGQYLMNYGHFLFLYLYDADGAISAGYQLDEFLLGEWTYDPIEGRLSGPTGDFSSITSLDLVGNGVVIVEVLHRLDRDLVDGRRLFRLRKDFHVVDLESGESALVGSNLGNHQSPEIERIFIDKDRLIVNTGGRLVEVTKQR